MAKQVIFLFLMLTCLILISPTEADCNVVSYGAKPDGATNAMPAFLRAWKAACGSARAATIYVPIGWYVLKVVEFRGPCKSRVTVKIDGTLVAPSDYSALGNSGYWILSIQVNMLTVICGTLDANGASYSACKNSGQSCPPGARVRYCVKTDFVDNIKLGNDIVLSGLTSINSKVMHIVINSCNDAMVCNVKAIAPNQSPNTDDIHEQSSNGFTITGSMHQSGDDCISIGPGTTKLYMSNIKCVPGHGISLGRDATEDGVRNVTLTNALFTGSDNGVRIKSCARPSTSFVGNSKFNLVIYLIYVLHIREQFLLCLSCSVLDSFL
ncbi:hypothetical protein EUGRSUZ_H00251 [Eucalyptus grandis]|uniref:Uncharacterized protein n=2 Tax=Eucalyptus grandis TaxID=71139 RepID=A0ACC3JJF3_EUCGR|nr:hypothetical protein EUGRSUZ_H00251 [Eucalyptus grandis]